MKSTSRHIVAVVDDDIRVLESLEDLLESAGHTVHLFRSAQSLLEDEAFGKIDCLISDIGMPTIDGFDLERLARAARPERQMTARGESRTFLLKPFSERELFSAINKALAL